MIFTWTPEFGANRTVQPNVNVVKFGDGYENRIPIGVNFKGFTWNLQFENRDAAEATAILQFLDLAGGVDAFDWTPPGLTKSYRFVCRQWSHTIQRANLYSIQASFERVYEP
ncbi:MAG: phage tail protein [Lysobacteraceae bacterium]|nr:MAG: phage tail protein [Xanthomonadaceae bacterium]